MELLDALVAKAAPVRMDDGGTLRVAGTRVRLDTVIGAFNNGSTPEEILFKYPALNLTDIYATITYYLWHRDEVDAYLQERQLLAAEVQRENEARFSPKGVRERLLARRAATP
jgi:uncharacterized protein (DUF433 family)